MSLRAEKAENALQNSSESFATLKIIQKNSDNIIQATKEIVTHLQEVLKKNSKDAEQKNIVLEELKEIVEKNRIHLEKKVSEYSQIHNLAFIDALTGLPNRRLLDDRLNQIILNNKRWKSYSAAIFVDIDRFKAINDTYGHEAGDALLIGVASRLTACIRASDTVARYGGDEFVVLLDSLDGNLKEAQKEANLVASKILTSLALPYTLRIRDGKKAIKAIEYQSFSSLGIAMFDGVMSDKESILDRADKAMYLSKNKGGNTIRFAVLPEQAKKP
ncbi:GGDEF domain-containing protein [Polynucleobacter sp. CS-Odin-A6]|uniref:GGDEF domain-containing protein n=1 Tax=Polynucleobacter sp. CS-Odin-A6 TaxID=2689106 RepID=UPI001C0C0161|nr:GGDEF domain-containing protein [Polynucleobacter sp. CS-Odin-A6]MBU3621573.1 diguanylate cyclase [Polynucleobacter sp. CS-Odin-A6]